MIRAAIAFFILALVAYIFGANGIAGMSMDIGNLLVVVFLIFAAISFIGGMITGRNPKQLL